MRGIDYQLCKAIIKQEVDKVIDAIAKGANVMTRGYDYVADQIVDDQEGEHPLMLACRVGNIDIVKVLLEHKADPNQLCELSSVQFAQQFGIDAMYPITVAAWNSQVDIIGLLHDYGADLECRDNHGDTPLMSVCANFWDENLRIVRKLVSLGANVNAQNNKGWSVIMNSVYGGDNHPYLLLAYLLSVGADPLLRTAEGFTVHEMKIFEHCEGDLDFIRKFCQAKLENLSLDGLIKTSTDTIHSPVNF